MAVATAIVLADAQATPVNHTFNPIGKDSTGTFWFDDQSVTNVVGFWRISVEIKRPVNARAGQNTSDRMIRVRVGLHEPVLETLSNSTVTGITPAPTVAYIPRSFTEYIIPERASLLDRKNLRKMTSSLNADANIVAVVENLGYLV